MKKRILIAIDSLRFGGIQKSLISFIKYIINQSDIDLLIWEKVYDYQIPNGVKILNITTVKSVRYSLRIDGLFSYSFILSLMASQLKKRWSIMSSIKKQYDIAIAYSNGGYGKYFLIDKVNANKKYIIFHNGEYIVTQQEKEFDFEYYPKFDMVFAVSEHVRNILRKELPDTVKFGVLPNLINVDEIQKFGNDECPEITGYKGLKILTVGRLSPEKNPMLLLEIARLLVVKNINFVWFIVGNGDMINQMYDYIKHNNLENYCILCGGQQNPYRFMKRCDLYVQLSKYEADPLTVKEVAVFGKRMILSDIPGFKSFVSKYKNVEIVDTECVTNIVNEIIKNVEMSNSKKMVWDINCNESAIKVINEIMTI